MEMTPNFPLRYKNASLGNGLVNMSAIYSFVWTYSNLISLSCTSSLEKWYFIAICLVLECITGFFDMLIALVLSQNMTTSSLISTFIPCNNFLNQTMLEQFTTATTYSASVVDLDVQFCFLLVQDTNLLPRKNAPPLVHFLSSIFLAQSALVTTFRSRFSPCLYHKL